LASETKTVTERKRLVLDAKILLRAVFGIRVLTLLETYEDSVSSTRRTLASAML
jgi:hypothetical protein